MYEYLGKQMTQAQEPTPYRIIQKQNCKLYKFHPKEIFPSIRPPMSKCCLEETTKWMSNTMKKCGCAEYVDPNWMVLNKNPYAAAAEKLTKVKFNNHDEFCKNRKPNEASPELRRKVDGRLDWNNITVYGLLRKENCKEYNFTDCEMYPSVRPTQFKCSPTKTANYLYGAIEDVFDIEPNDVLETWKQIPKEKSLRFYGVSSRRDDPVAIVFNRLISKCVEKAGKPKPKQTKNCPKQMIPKHLRKAPCGLILNRSELEKKVADMPTVVTKLDFQQTFRWRYSPRCKKRRTEPFAKESSIGIPVPLEAALDMQKPVEVEKHGLRRKNMYCELMCDIPENKCTDFEWRNYLNDPGDYNVTDEEIIEKPEPKNYDELFAELVACFDRKLCDANEEKMKKCCDTLNKGGGDANNDDDESYISDGLGDQEDGGDKGDGDGDGGDGGRGGRRIHRVVPKASKPKKAIPSTDKVEVVPPSAVKIPSSESSNMPPSETDSTPPTAPKPTPLKPKKKVSKRNEKDCPCDICKFMKKRKNEPDSPLITRLKEEEKRRKLKDYIKIMCHREYIKNCCPEYRAPLRKCEDIVCDDCFCDNPKFKYYCDCLGAIQELQDVLFPNVSSELQTIKDRMSTHLCACV